MKLFTKLWFTLLCVLMAGVTNVYADDEVALTADMFYTWDGDGANASSISQAQVDFKLGEEVGPGTTIAGTGSVTALIYADLTGCAKIKFEGKVGLRLRVLLNRVDQPDGQGALVEKNPVIGDDGKVELDLTDLTFVHVNAIKLGWGDDNVGTVTSIKVVKPSDPLAIPKENLKKALSKAKLYNTFAYTDASFLVLQGAIDDGATELANTETTEQNLTAATNDINNAIAALVLKDGFISLKDVDFGVFDSWGAGAKLTQKLDPTWHLFAATDLSYGDVSVNNRADVSAYDKLYVVTASGSPRILLNRDADGGQWSENESDSHLIDNTKGGWSAKYFSTENGITTVDLKQLVADKGFAHLTAIKSYDNNVVTGLYLYTAPTYTATFTTNRGWEKVYAYVWSGEGENKLLGDWPGTELTATEGVYTVTIQAAEAPANIIFNSGAGVQTDDLVFENGKAYEFNKEDSELMAQAKTLAADADAVAVGKLTAAIAAAQSSGDESNLQAAINQFNADNADMEKDETAKVKTDGWKKFTGNDAAGVCATQFAPAIDTYDGRKNVQLAENYETTVETTGTIIYQDITGLANGSYKVGFYGNAFFTSGRGFESTMEDGANDVAYVFANDQKEFITARVATSTTENNYRQFNVEVTDGTIKLGMGKEKPGTNWHTMQIHQLTWFTTAKAAYAAVKAEMETEIVSAKALKTESRTAGVDEFNAAIEAAEAAFDSNMLNVPEFEAELANLKAAAAAFKKANYFIDFAAGEYYIVDAESGKMMAAGNDYGTRGIVNEMGLDLTLTPYTESRTVTVNSRVANNETNHFLGNNLYMDSSEWGWALEYQGFGFYIVEPDGGKYINIDANDNLVLSDTPREWIIVTADGVKAQRMEELATATAENPVDATFLLQNPNFNRNDQRVAAWEWNPTQTAEENPNNWNNHNFNGGNQVNNCAESYHAAFTVMQTISNAPAGLYKLTAQGFYRQDTYEGDAPAAPQFFANGVNRDVPVKTGEENGMSAASASFTNGLYTIEPIEFEVKADGMMYVGITASTNTQWVIFDNFQLTYNGPVPATTYTVSVAEAVNGQVEVDKTVAAEGETVTVTVTPAEGYMVDEAYWTYGEGENVTKTNIEEPAEGNAAQFTMPAANVTVTVTFKAISGPVEIEKFYIMGTGTTSEWNGTTEMTYNEETQAFEYTVEGENGLWIAFSDIDWTASDEGWADFNGNHRYAIGKGNQNATVGEAMQLQKTEGEGTIVLAAGKYNVSVTKSLLCTITKVESELPVEGVIYSWESPEGTPVEYGGKIEHVYGKDNRLNYLNSGYYTICLNGKKANVNDDAVDNNKDSASRMIITLDNAVAEGDTIAITGYITKNSSAKSSAWIVYENGATAESAVFGDESNIFVPEGGQATGVINTKYVIVSAEAAGSKTITLTRGQTGTNLFITKLQVIEKKAEPETIETMYIVGELTGGWPTDDDWSNARAMTQDAENDAIWTLNVESFEAEAKTYKYKATANAKWGLYELPASGDNTFDFGTEEYPVGKYSLLFTVNTTDNTLTLVATPVDVTGINTLKTAIENGAVYNLNGQKVMKAQKGLYIINGKKVVKK